MNLIGRSTAVTTVDEWIENGGMAKFTKPYGNTEVNRVECSIMYSHCGNNVFADAKGATSGDAFLGALAKIEKTIREWRK